jgi:NADH-quinone oxidoreductase subunit G
MIKIQIDGKTYEVNAGKNLLQTCLSLGFDIPYFCYHPALGSVGACRLCAVKKFKNQNDSKGQIVMSCMEPLTDGMIISVNDPEVKEFRASVIEGLMLNHPHDCPVCDEGGECHLQDMTVMTGHNYRRYNFKKRTYQNQYLGPFIKHEMNRCIQCYRCVRFYRDYAGGKDLNVYGSANRLYFGRHEEGKLESEFSGNLVEICPTGVFTDKLLHKSYTRKWDMSNAPSVCVHCSVGCNTIVSERYGSVRRIMSRYNGAVNGYLLCDRGRFGFEFVNDDQKRIKKALVRYSKNSEFVEKGDEAILSVITCAIAENKVAAIGSPRASLESNFALQTLFGKENFYHGISSSEQKLIKTILNIYQNSPVYSPSLKEMEKADAVLVLGEDLTNTAPLMALALRQASRTTALDVAEQAGIPEWHDQAVRELAQDIKTPFYVATPFPTKLDELAEKLYRAPAANIARLGFAIASFISNNAPVVKDLDNEDLKIARDIAVVLKTSKNPLIISGTHLNSIELIEAAGNISMALANEGIKANLSFSLPECNSLGLGFIEGGNLDEVIQLIEKDMVKTLIILENDLYRRTESDLLSCLTEKCPQVIVLDHTLNDTALKADILFPVQTFAESQGTYVNNEGRAQRFYSVIPPNNDKKESWQWLRDMMLLFTKSDRTTWQHFDDVVKSMCNAVPVFEKLKEIPDAGFRMYNEKISRQTHRFSGRTAMNAHVAVSEQKPPPDTDSPFAYSMEGYKGLPPANLVPFYWSPGWNSVQANNKYLDEPAGSNIGGNAGVKLFGYNPNNVIAYFKNIPNAHNSGKDEWNIVPVHLIFGSEELSANGNVISELIPEPFICISEKDCINSNLIPNLKYDVRLNGQKLRLIIKNIAGIPEGIAGISYGIPGMPYISLPVVSKLEFSVVNDPITTKT